MDSETTTRKGKDEQENFEAKQNLLGFFGLLLKIDMRNNPEKYKIKNFENNENNRGSNSADKTE